MVPGRGSEPFDGVTYAREVETGDRLLHSGTLYCSVKTALRAPAPFVGTARCVKSRVDRHDIRRIFVEDGVWEAAYKRSSISLVD
jgi:hypothetical protein